MQKAMSMPAPAPAPSMPLPAGITTEQIQKYLDENKQLILAILENQNLGKLAECAQYQIEATRKSIRQYLDRPAGVRQYWGIMKKLGQLDSIEAMLHYIDHQHKCLNRLLYKHPIKAWPELLLSDTSTKARYQAQLQKNLLYLAAIADAQPQTSISRPQMAPPGASPGVGQYMSQVPMFPPRTPLTPQQMQEQQMQQQQAQMLPFGGQMVARPGVANGMPHPAGAASRQDAGGATSEPSGTESHKSTGTDNDGGSDFADKS